jgi:hypothetical protein
MTSIGKALVYIRNGPEYADLRDIACGVIFLGTPHSGSGVALIGATLVNIAKITFRRPASQLLQALQLNSSPLLDLTNTFKPIHAQLNLVSFCEQLPMTAGTVSGLFCITFKLERYDYATDTTYEHWSGVHIHALATMHHRLIQ